MFEKLISKINKIILIGCLLLTGGFTVFYFWGQKENQDSNWKTFLMGKVEGVNYDEVSELSDFGERVTTPASVNLISEDSDGKDSLLRVAFAFGGAAADYVGAYNEEYLNLISQKLTDLDVDFVIFVGGLANIPKMKSSSEKELSNLKNFLDVNFKNYYVVFGKSDLACGDDCFDLWQKVFWAEATSTNRRAYHVFNQLGNNFFLASSNYPGSDMLDISQKRFLGNFSSQIQDERLILVASSLGKTFEESPGSNCFGESCLNLVDLIGKKNRLVIGDFSGKLFYTEMNGVDFITSIDATDSPQREFLLVDFFDEKVALMAVDIDGGNTRILKK